MFYATKTRSGITKLQRVWKKDIDEPAPTKDELPDGRIHFNQRFIKTKADAQIYVTDREIFKGLKWLEEVPNEPTSKTTASKKRTSKKPTKKGPRR
jgi:hypothetical protein